MFVSYWVRPRRPRSGKKETRLRAGKRRASARPVPNESPVFDPDRDLVLRTVAGDRRAFDALAARHAAPLARLLRRYVPNAHEAEDVQQQALARAYERIGSFRGASTFRTW